MMTSVCVLKKKRERTRPKFISPKDVIDFEAACCGQEV